MKQLKLHQAGGVLLIVAGFAWLYYDLAAPGNLPTLWSLALMLAGGLWYGVARFLLWYRKD